LCFLQRHHVLKAGYLELLAIYILQLTNVTTAIWCIIINTNDKVATFQTPAVPLGYKLERLYFTYLLQSDAA
jgi:hypothetical protein